MSRHMFANDRPKNVKKGYRFLLSLNEEQKKAKRMQDKFNQDIEELGEETDSLVEEIEKWQI